MNPIEISNRIAIINEELKIMGAPFGLGEIVFNKRRNERQIICEVEKLNYSYWGSYIKFPPFCGFKFRLISEDIPKEEIFTQTAFPKLTAPQIYKECIATGERIDFIGNYPAILTTRMTDNLEEVERCIL